ncbi:TauD/TfdA family dioxygenase [Photorhabdus laumondii]|uniref:TauD/TfdA family dioxygenase n=1 Tax=Photorhabdus laumondii TaxID=2218628 RepID=UPI000D6325F4|nr:TauD/TfdA family dioxygenase [Photorhabdus laumondii]AWK41975.1 hypothetical protein A4R40_10995 [Photorhabdus laumondii subsp. laumondii]
MNESYQIIDDDPAVWCSAQLESKKDVLLPVSDEQIEAFRHHLSAMEDRPSEAFNASDFSFEEITILQERIHQRLTEGRGVVVVSGIPREMFTDSILSHLFWGIGTGLGRPVVQNSQGHRIGHVRNEKNNPNNRGYMSNRELGFHSDAFEIVGLMCLREAASGGLTQIVSGLAIYNQMLREKPELLDALFEGYHYATAERSSSKLPYTSYKIPIFSKMSGRVSSMCLGAYMRAAAKLQGLALPDALDAGLHAFYEICNRPEFRLEFMLEPGEILFLNNYTTLHSRTEFQDDALNQRHLLRLWIELSDGRPVVPALTARGRDYEQLFLETRLASTAT